MPATARILAGFSTRRDGRVVDGGGVENHCTGNRILQLSASDYPAQEVIVSTMSPRLGTIREDSREHRWTADGRNYYRIKPLEPKVARHQPVGSTREKGSSP